MKTVYPMQHTPRTQPPKRPRRMPVRLVMQRIRQAHGSVGAFAKVVGANYDHLRDVIYGRETSSRLAAEIAAVVGRAPHEIWPRLYAEDGGPLSTLYRRAS